MHESAKEKFKLIHPVHTRFFFLFFFVCVFIFWPKENFFFFFLFGLFILLIYIHTYIQYSLYVYIYKYIYKWLCTLLWYTRSPSVEVFPGRSVVAVKKGSERKYRFAGREEKKGKKKKNLVLFASYLGCGEERGDIIIDLRNDQKSKGHEMIETG